MRTRIVHLLFVCFILLSPTLRAYGAEPMVLHDGFASYHLGGAHLDILEDPGGTLTIAEIVSPEITARFQPNRMHIPNFGITDSVFWLRFTLLGETPGNERWLLLFDQPLTNRVDLYLPQADGRFQVLFSGEFTPLDARPIPGKDILFPLPVTATAQTFYLRTWVPGRAQMPMTVLSEGAMRRIESRQVLTFGIYAGIIVCLSLVAFFIYLLLRVRDYLLFIAYIFTLFLAQLGLNGFLHLWIPASVLDYAMHFLWSCAVSVAFLFERSFLRTATCAPRMDAALKWVAVVFFIAPLSSIWSVLISIRLLTALTPLATFLAISAAVVVWRQGSRAAGYYLLARLTMYAVVVLFAMNNCGWISLNLVQYPILIYGSLLCILFIVIAMSSRFRDMKIDLDTTLTKLQWEVVERTAAHRAMETEMAERIRLEREIVSVSDEERRRISHELHDGLCQELAGARLYYTALQGNFTDADIAVTEVRQLGTVLDRAVNHAYDLSRGLWPLDHDAKMAMASLKALVRRLADQSGVRIEFHHEQLCVGCADNRLTQVYGIAREALGNAVKHSQATEIVISLVCGADRGITMEVRDNGVGRQAITHTDGGMGLGIMAHRAAIIGGRLEIADAEGGGTVVRCTSSCKGDTL